MNDYLANTDLFCPFETGLDVELGEGLTPRVLRSAGVHHEGVGAIAIRLVH